MSLPKRATSDLVNPEEKKEYVVLSDQGIQEIIYHVFYSNQIPPLLKKGGGGMISKVVDGKENLWMILEEPEDQINKKYFRYSIIHEHLDNSVQENRSILDIEKEVWIIYQSELSEENPNPTKEEQKEYIQSRIDFFQGQLDQNNSITELSEEDKQHNFQIQETLDWLDNKFLIFNS